MRVIATLSAGIALIAAPPVVAQTATENENPGTEKTATVQAHVDAYRSGDLDRFVATFSSDATVDAGGMIAKGHAEIREFYATNFADDDFRHTLRVVDSGMSEGRVYLSAAYTFSDGVERCCSYSEYEISDGKITHLSVDF